MEEEFRKIESGIGWDNYFVSVKERSRNHAIEIGDRALNRYEDVIPYDHSRIKLTRAKETDYINANLVTVPKAARSYILTQGPLPVTLGHFWLMVWEQKSNVIVMLNRVVEFENFVKCEPYWPKYVNSTDTYSDVKISVTLDSIRDKKHYTIRYMTIKDHVTDKERKVTQFYYTAWPDHGSPDSPTSLLRLLTAIRKSGGLEKMDEPAIVHCSAGIGRSGTFCLIDSILCMIENQGSTEGIDIVGTLIEMRDYRKGLIQSPVQLRFAYLAIIYGIKVLEKANKLNHHMLTPKNGLPSENSKNSKKVPEVDVAAKKGLRKTKRRSSKTGSLNLFQKQLLVEAFDDVDSDAAENLFYDMMKPWPSYKKPKNDSFSEDEEKPPKLRLGDIKLSESPGVKSPSFESSLLRRREKNQRLAEKTYDIKTKMKEEEAKREWRARQVNILKKSAVYGGLAALVFGSMLYTFIIFKLR